MEEALDLLGLAEIGALLGVSRQRVDQLARTEGFPDPVATLSAGRIWQRDDVEAWARQTGRT
ncbi:MAG: helix-turn-helix transcriptional regulator [Iamia sp.]